MDNISKARIDLGTSREKERPSREVCSYMPICYMYCTMCNSVVSILNQIYVVYHLGSIDS